MAKNQKLVMIEKVKIVQHRQAILVECFVLVSESSKYYNFSHVSTKFGNIELLLLRNETHHYKSNLKDSQKKLKQIQQEQISIQDSFNGKTI